ncbi:MULTISPECIES: hypothetical protein [unclassified Streptomyces]|uniref:hypothetical protein n=1 Tax=unclassified Streptomyces TaxID=2593676 RepID=UPI00093D9F92|nr:hypothetical protein [Streptomyces sp. CB02400]OKJ97226.1 hypothetical protein AMK33_30025 [Streptomyces sp. CB02400]
MEAQTWNHLPFQWRTPTLPDIVLSGVTAYVLHCQPDIPEPVAVTAALMVLRCIRYVGRSRIRR